MSEKRCVITGASSGIGAALARELAARGWSLALLARRIDLLIDLERELTSRGCKAVALPCDVVDAASVREAIESGARGLGGTFDLAIANAGVSIPGHATKFSIDDAERVIRVNVLGMMYLFDAVIPSMVERQAGHFAGVASLAGLRGLPSAAAYSASKAAMQAFLEASRIELMPYGVSVTTINPGFVATQMTEKNRFRMPFLMTPEDSARIIVEGLERRARVVQFPTPMSLLMRLTRIMPSPLYERMVGPYGRRRINYDRVRR